MYNELKFVYLKSHPLFTNLSEEQLIQACGLMKIKTVYRSESFDYGEGITVKFTS